LNNSMSLVKSSLENQPYYNIESIFRAFKRKEMKASRRLAENDIITTYNIILYVHTFLFWHFSYRTCAFCKARSDWLQLPLAALHINRHRVTSKIRLTMPRVKMNRADHNPWLAKMGGVTSTGLHLLLHAFMFNL
jgi:hypothetical protein